MGSDRALETRDAVLLALRALGVSPSATSASALALELGRLYRDLGELDLALRSYVIALELQGRSGDVSDLCRAQAGLVSVRALRGDTADAADTLAQVRALAERDGLDLAQAEIAAATALVERVAGAPAAGMPGSAAPPRTIALTVLGAFELRIDGAPISDRRWRTSKAKELFALLALRPERPSPRDQLIECLWPESDVEGGVSNFHFTLHCLRKALALASAGKGPVIHDQGGYRLALAAPVSADIDAFQRDLARGTDLRRTGLPDEAAEALRAAIACYGGEFLSGVDAEWLEERRTSLQRRYLAACRQLAEIELERRRPEAAIAAAERYLAVEPYDEPVHRIVMRALDAAGDTAGATRHFERLAARLRAELNEAPEAATRQLHAALTAPGRSHAPLARVPLSVR